MTGIELSGGYVPRLRLDRASVALQMGWFNPALIMAASGARSVCNWDEDALTLAVAAARDCLAGTDRTGIDAVHLSSTSMPFADRSCAGVLKTALNLPDETFCADFAGSQRCGTAGLLAALDAVASGSRSRVLVAAGERRETRAAGLSELWFGDGGAAAVVGGGRPAAEFLGSFSISRDLVDHARGAHARFDLAWEERWVRDEGYGKLIPEAVSGLLGRLGMSAGQVDLLAYPCPFPAEHRRIGKEIGAAPGQIVPSLFEECGETGAVHPLLLLALALERARAGQTIVVAGFGQGCDALCFRATDAIGQARPAVGVSGWLGRSVPLDSYPRFLAFRGHLRPDAGLRAEAPARTALTVLYRKREMLTGMVGGCCTACGTRQFPLMEICVNPACRATGTQAPHPFADEPAFVKSFTSDLLAVSPDPPSVYGMVQFENGGRFMADFTDCDPTRVAVGQPVRLVFRRRQTERETGFSGYFWKAVPETEPRPAGSEGR